MRDFKRFGQFCPPATKLADKAQSARLLAQLMGVAAIALMLPIGAQAEVLGDGNAMSDGLSAKKAAKKAANHTKKARNAGAKTEGKADRSAEKPQWALVIHGGAGTLTRERLTPELEREYRTALAEAMEAGEAILASGGAAIDAVQAVITRLEDDPKFNAGRGAVFTWDGTNEMDASFMDGNGRRAGAIAGVTQVKNPILLARKVMDDGRHVMLSGEGAEIFAKDNGIALVDASYFATPHRRQQLETYKAKANAIASNKQASVEAAKALKPLKYGTVGAAALDMQGHLAAGTSTGGTTGKRWGRIGDSPVIGAGTYADDRACAVSATGTGEYFIRVSAAKSICDRMAQGESAQAAADAVIADIGSLGGDGGVIVMSPMGNGAFSFNTEGMYRARANANGVSEIAIFGDED